MGWIKLFLDKSRTFSVFDYVMFKIVLVTAGILIGGYFAPFIMPHVWIVWTLFAISYIYMAFRMFMKR